MEQDVKLEIVIHTKVSKTPFTYFIQKNHMLI